MTRRAAHTPANDAPADAVTYSLMVVTDQLGAKMLMLLVQDGVQVLTICFAPEGAQKVGAAMLAVLADRPEPTTTHDIPGLHAEHSYNINPIWSAGTPAEFMEVNLSWHGRASYIGVNLKPDPAQRLAEGLIEAGKRAASPIELPGNGKIALN